MVNIGLDFSRTLIEDRRYASFLQKKIVFLIIFLRTSRSYLGSQYAETG